MIWLIASITVWISGVAPAGLHFVRRLDPDWGDHYADRQAAVRFTTFTNRDQRVAAAARYTTLLAAIWPIALVAWCVYVPARR